MCPPSPAGDEARPGRRDLDQLVATLTLDEKALLTAGADMWSTVAVERVGIPAVHLTDGPSGARGPWLFGVGTSSVCVPCGTALGATWDPSLVEEVGDMLGGEARSRGCRVLLAPTVNIHRSPLAGRNFECYSEDPLLSGTLAVAFVRGVQARGVATTVKHFVGNDAEFERMSMSSVVDERTLREIYLLPFEMAVREGGALGVMTGYNRLNGEYCAAHETLLNGVLRQEWGFEGFVVSDWFAHGSTVGSARAGLDLEMPGPGRIYGKALADAVRAGDVPEAVVDAHAHRLLAVFDALGALDDGQDAAARPEDRSEDRPEDRHLARRAAASSTVLLKNEDVLPLAPTALRSIALIGPNANRAQIMGGGSSAVAPHYRRTPLEELRDRLGSRVSLLHERGCDIDRSAPLLDAAAVRGPDGGAGFAVEFLTGDIFATGVAGEVVARATGADSQLMFFGAPPDGVPAGAFSFRAAGRFTPVETGRYTFSLVQAGRSRLLVDQTIVLDGVTDPPPRGTAFFGAASKAVVAEVPLVAGRGVELVAEFAGDERSLIRGVRLGCRLPAPEDLLERAVDAASRADAAVVVVGTTDEWEREGTDRADMALPGRQDELITAVAAANPRTVVVVNAGSPIEMPWVDDAAAVLQIWFGGQEMAAALADVLLGGADPGGRLPTTLPLRLEHNPSFGNFPGENGELRYGEGLLVGYRWYESRHLPVRFPFGHGLSYTSFTIDPPHLSADRYDGGAPVRLDVRVTNSGTRAGSEVVQCYVAPPASARFRPAKELKAFAKVSVEPGDSAQVTLSLDARAFASYDPAGRQRSPSPGAPPDSGSPAQEDRNEAGWYVDPGTYRLHVGRSSADISHVVDIEVDVDPTGPLAGPPRSHALDR